MNKSDFFKEATSQPFFKMDACQLILKDKDEFDVENLKEFKKSETIDFDYFDSNMKLPVPCLFINEKSIGISVDQNERLIKNSAKKSLFMKFAMKTRFYDMFEVTPQQMKAIGYDFT